MGIREGMGVTQSWPNKANSVVRSRVRSRENALELGRWQTDRQTDRRSVHYMMMIMGDVAVLQPRDYEDFQAWVPHRRDLDEDEDRQPAWVPTPECFISASRTCTAAAREAYADDPLGKIRNTDVREICEYV